MSVQNATNNKPMSTHNIKHTTKNTKPKKINTIVS